MQRHVARKVYFSNFRFEFFPSSVANVAANFDRPGASEHVRVQSRTPSSQHCSEAYVSTQCDIHAGIPLLRTGVDVARLRTIEPYAAKWKFCYESRMKAFCKKPSNVDVDQACKCQACFWYNSPKTYSGAPGKGIGVSTTQPISGPINNIVRLVCQNRNSGTGAARIAAAAAASAAAKKKPATTEETKDCQSICKGPTNALKISKIFSRKNFSV